MSENREYTVTFTLNEEQEAQLEELKEAWQQYRGKDGNKPFKDWTIEKTFEAIMQYGSKYMIDAQIKKNQYELNLITTEQMLDSRYKRTPERREKQ